jgi:hypothetical protein
MRALLESLGEEAVFAITRPRRQLARYQLALGERLQRDPQRLLG